jgi:hypothetical protein
MTATMIATIEEVNALLEGTTIAPIALPRKAQTSAPTMRDPKRDAQMATLKPSSGQFQRINSAHRDSGLRPYRTMRDFCRIFPTMLDASLYYASL